MQVPVSNDLISLFLHQLQAGAILIFVQNWLKKSKWFPLLTYESEKLNHIFSIVASLAATVGISFSFNSNDHQLIISGLSWSLIFTNAWHWVTQYITTKVGYIALKGQLSPPSVQTPTPVVVVPDSKPLDK